MSASFRPAFAFVPKQSVEEFRQFWLKNLKETRTRLTDLERPRKGIEVESYLDELNSLHFLGNLADARGEIWRDMHPDALLREEAKEASKAFVDLYSEVFGSTGIADNLSKFETAKFPVEEDSRRFLKVWKDDLRKGGAYLQSDGKAEVKRLNREIAECMEEFQENIRNDRTRLDLLVKELLGLPEDYLANRTVDPSTKKLTIVNKSADTSPILDYCRIQTTREKVYRFVGTKASPVNEKALRRLLDLRHEMACVLGYATSAQLDLQDTMAKTPEEVARFLDEVHAVVKPRAEREILAISSLLKQSEAIEPQPWDMLYGKGLLKSHLLPGFDQKSARQYFQSVKAFPALQKIAQKLFNLRFEEIEGIDAWHPTVTASAVYDLTGGTETLIGRIFFDIYPREGKVDGAAAYTARRPVAHQQLGEVILYANMPEQEGACMSYREVQTILHELGHCVHALTAKQRYDRFAGIEAVAVDFVESPSKMLELWLTDEHLFDFAVNRQGERISGALLRQLTAADEVGRGMTKRNSVAMSKYCLELHSRKVDDDAQITDIVADVYKRYNNFEVVPGMSPHLSLSHIATQTYGSRLYSYLFSEVICHDIFREFQKTGNLMDKATAASYRKVILEKGSSQDPQNFIEEFLGRKYDSTAYMNWLNAGNL